MGMNLRYKVNAPNVVYEIIEGEAVIVNLRKGYYYSLQAAGVNIWDAIAQGFSANEVIKNLSMYYDAKPQDIESAVTDLISKFTEEKLIVPRKPDEPAGTLDKGSALHSGAKVKFIQPVFERFTDMEDVLLLDPIHDVDERGWPNRPTDSTV